MIGIFITAEAFIDGYRGHFHENLKIFRFLIFAKCSICHPPFEGNYHVLKSKSLCILLTKNINFKSCVQYIFASLFFTCKREHLWNKKKCFLFHFKSSFCFWNNQILTFQIFKCNDVIKCLSMKHETHFIEELGK